MAPRSPQRSDRSTRTANRSAPVTPTSHGLWVRCQRSVDFYPVTCPQYRFASNAFSENANRRAGYIRAIPRDAGLLYRLRHRSTGRDFQFNKNLPLGKRVYQLYLRQELSCSIYYVGAAHECIHHCVGNVVEYGSNQLLQDTA